MDIGPFKPSVLSVLFISLIFSTLFLLNIIYVIIFGAFFIATILYLRNKYLFFFFLLLLVPMDRFYLPIFYKLKFYQIVFIGVALMELISILVGKKRDFIVNWNLLDTSVLLIFLGRIASLSITIDYASSIKALILYAFFALLYFYIRHMAVSIKPDTMVKFMIFSSLFFIGLGFIEFILGKLGLIASHTAEEIYIYGGRPQSVFREPDWFGGYLTFIIALTIPFVGSEKCPGNIYRKNKIILLLAIVMSLLIVVRSSWLGLLAGVLLIFVLSKKSKKIILSSMGKLSVIITIFLIFLLVFSFSNFRSVQDRFFSTFVNIGHRDYDAAAQVRINSYSIILDYIYKKPIQGYGVGVWEFLSQRHEHINPSLSTNNVLLTPVFEMGILGVILYLIFIIALFKMILAGVKYASTEMSLRYAIGIAIAVVGTMIVSIFNDIMLTGFYWAFIAIFNNYVNSLKVEYENITLST